MKERSIGIGLGAVALLTLGALWPDSAQAFSLGTPVTVTNILDRGALGSDIFQGPTDVVVIGDEVELSQFGGIWDIDLGDRSISFTLNSLFGNVTSGNDIYRFLATDFGEPGQYAVTGFTVIPQENSLEFAINPIVRQRGNNWIDIVFPLGFAPGTQPNLTAIPGQLGFRVDLTVEPIPIPTPALLPGLMGMGLAILRQRRGQA
ncbi:PTPA-CTERM sorting domain-containing protein [Nodosilinea sp. E11]|uniref:PTPA-CTERM sorting domain-containing protein n=1 Tax=Nodosilinea sp. E11 TaxID=3037479 RepID=UPI00293501DB|nr:PTPA-CTERM sorting domain-containing protein [Nodosilinea sp. E11]WOD37728.1 PTPA-CTERM sorting domain-containing protein [Nodosilinea sp. E11]